MMSRLLLPTGHLLSQAKGKGPLGHVAMYVDNGRLLPLLAVEAVLCGWKDEDQSSGVLWHS